MSVKIILYIAMSRDGFIADTHGGVSWLDPFSVNVPLDVENMDYAYPKFWKSIDCVVMGRKTYEQMLTFGDWPNIGKHSYVFTESTKSSPRADISFIKMSAEQFVHKIEAEQPGCSVWLEGGANVVQQFYDAGLIDEYIITTIPIELGTGIALPEGIVEEKDMIETNSKTYSNGIMQKRYIRRG